MKKFVLILAAAAAMAAFSTSCSIYHPQAVDIPLINHQGDGRVDVGISMSTFVVPDVMCLNATASYGFNDWLAGQVHFNYGGENYYLQAAPGVYFPMSDNFVFETYLGFGYGGAQRDKVEFSESSSSLSTMDFKGHYSVPFAQVNLGWHDLSKVHFDFGIGLKAGAYIPNFDYTYYAKDGSVSKTDVYKNTNFLFEPQAMVRFGGETVKVNLKLGFAFLSDLESSKASIYYDMLTASAGLTFCF